MHFIFSCLFDRRQTLANVYVPFTVSGSITAATQAIIRNVETDRLFAIALRAAITNGRANPAAITARSATIYAARPAVDEAAEREEE
jgi:hypothetical protein